MNIKKLGESKNKFNSLPEGRYDVEVAEATIDVSSKNKKMLKVTFNVLHDKYKNRKVWKNFIIEEDESNQKAIMFFYSFLESIESDLLDKEDVDPNTIPAAIIGKVCNVYSAPTQTSNGNASDNISNFKKATPKTTEPPKKGAMFK